MAFLFLFSHSQPTFLFLPLHYSIGFIFRRSSILCSDWVAYFIYFFL